ncbi:MAG: primosomal protein N' [Meiothermus sp.]|nr:primosomal protein N' [Meiothermus sp.]
MRILKVTLPLPLEPMSYLPPHADVRRGLGHRVVVPWRGELRTGVVVGEEDSEHKSFTLREAVTYLDEWPWLGPPEIEFLRAAARDSFCPLGLMLGDLVPFLEPPLSHSVRLLPNADPSVLPPGLESLVEGWQDARALDPKLLDFLRESGVIEEEVSERRSSRQVLVLKTELDRLDKLSEKAKSALYALQDLKRVESMAELARAAGVGAGVVKGLVDKGFIGFEEVEPEPEAIAVRRLEPLPLNTPDFASIRGGRLLERVRALSTLAQTERLLVLFPEVSLLRKFRPFFPAATVLHGEMKPEERRKVWTELARADAGENDQEPQTESSAPSPLLSTYQGLLLPRRAHRVVVVEEGAEAYKLAAGSRVFVPHLAQLRAEMLGVPVTFLSAVSSAEVWERAAVELEAPKPRLHLLDMRQERGWPISGAALALLRQVAEKGRQAVVLSARRGFSAMLRCKQCDWKAMCPNCELPLRYHRSGRLGILRCHQCGHEHDAPELCPSCQSDVFDPRGPGVDWLNESLRQQLPDLPRYRYTAEAKDNLSALLEGRPGVLVGTTAILRGPTLPELALVLLPYADGFVMESDFRASERYHRLLWQLADLHPRRRPLLVLQTFEPNHPAHKALQTADPQAFMEFELALRHALHYPPVTRIVKLEVSHPKEPQARDAAEQVANLLRPRVQPGELLGPAPAPVPKLRNQYVFHLLLKTSDARLHELLEGLSLPRGARVRLDPDPQSFVGLLED